MKMQMFVIYDSKAEVYNKPFYQLNDACALRTARDLRSTPNNEINNNPEDYSMFHLGEYDDSNAQIDLNSSPKIFLKFHEIPLNTPTDADVMFRPELQGRANG